MALATLLARDAGEMLWTKESSSAYEETIDLAPMFVTQPRDMTCYEGQAAHFDCRVEPVGDGSMTVEWYHNDKPIQVGSRTHTLNDFGFVVLDIDWTFKRDSGVYRCVVTNRCGSVESKAMLKCISNKDAEEQQPSASTVCMVHMEKTMQKYTTEMFLTEEDVFDAELRQPPRFMSQIRSIKGLKEMQRAKFECQLGPVGDPSMKIEWFYNGEPLIAKTQFTPIYDFGYIALNFGWVYKQDTGEYTCRATNNFGTAETKATLVCTGKSGINYESQLPAGMTTIAQIQDLENRAEREINDEPEIPRMKPVFMTKPEAVTVTEGAQARFCCRVSGHPKPRVMWLINGQTVINGSRRKLIFDGMWHLEIPKCQEGGKIEVIARNQCGEAYATTTLRVRRRKDFRSVLNDEKRMGVEEFVNRNEYRKPLWLVQMEEIKEKLAAIVQAAKITKEIQTNRIKTGQSAEFVAGYAGNPQPDITWWCNGAQIQESSMIKITIDNTSSTLSMADCGVDMEGIYECRVHNKLASDKTKASLVVAGHKA